MKKNKILAISHTFVKKINLSFYEKLYDSRLFKITCVGPRFINMDNKRIYPDFKTENLNPQLNFKKLILKNKKSRLFYFKGLAKIIKTYKPNFILFDNDPISLQSFFVIYYSFFFKYKICYFSLENDLLNIFKNISLKKILKIIILSISNLVVKRWVYKIFCFTNEIKRNYDLLGYKNKTSIIPLGYNENIFKLRKKQKTKYFTIAYFGRIAKEKGLLTLLKALNHLKFNNWIFMIDMDHVVDKKYLNELKPYLKKLAKKKKLKIISCNYFEISKFMSKSDIVVVPSEYPEQYGRVIQESVASGALVIGSNLGGISEIIDNKKLLFSPGNYIQIAKIINKSFYNKIFYKQQLRKIYKNIRKQRTISRQAELFIKTISI